MKTRFSSPPLALLLCGLSSCALEQPEQADIVGEHSDREDPLYAASTKIWRTLSIPVCWENPSLANANERGWVRNAVARTWENSSLVSFTQWDTCVGADPGIHIRVSEEGPHTVAFGTALNGVRDGMHLNFNFLTWGTECKTRRQSCIEAIAVHEFGHALGFAHEQNRSDRPSSCKDAPQGDNGDVFVGVWDSASVMNYCNPMWNNGGALSAGDIEAVGQYYGSFNNSIKRQDAINWGNGKIYFFNGNQYSGYDIAKNRIDDLYPRPILGNWPGWPSTWTDGVDAAINWGNGKAYFFRGNQYIRYDLATNRVDPGYPALTAQNWQGWPAHWTGVDAALMWSKDFAYFFRGSEYLRFNLPANRVDPGYPVPIVANWPGLFPSTIEYTVSLAPSSGRVYFFRGLEYERFDVATNRVDAGYPYPIVGWWPGVAF